MFSLSKYEDTNGLEVQIIKDWKEMLTQVGDHQSLLQSLKDSPYFKGILSCRAMARDTLYAEFSDSSF